ncbi:MAG: DEAD/DEAH box helicase [Pseudomonadota bacterium]
MKFTELGLNPKVLEAVVATGYETPTPIQAQAIPHALEGRDVLGIAQTGTGKTASFTLPMLTLLAKGRARARMPRSLILAPTRELAAQVSENFETYGANLNLSKALLIGGVSFGEQDKIIDRGVDVLIATPGRLLDHFERGKLMLTGIEIMVVDEADRMLDMGFIEDLERIFKLTPFTRQTLFFSATMPPEITRLTQEFLSNPVRVEVARASSTADTVEQRLCPVQGSRRDRLESEKRRVLRALIDAEGADLTNAIIFCNRKRDVATLYKSLSKHEYNVGALHGDLDQRIRMQVLDGFRNGQIKLLVASDVAARGLDIPTVSHVFNFDVPVHAEDYVHRIGRTGRAGRSGVAVTLATGAEDKALAKVEELIKKPIPRVETPGGGAETVDISADGEVEEAPRSRRGGRSRGTRDREDGRGRHERGNRSWDDGWENDRPRRAEADEGGRETRADRGQDRGFDRERDRDRREDRREDRRDDRGERGRGGRRRGGRYREDRDPPVVGMGDHVPAFLMREVTLPTRRRRETDDALEQDVAAETAAESDEVEVVTALDQSGAEAASRSEDAEPQRRAPRRRRKSADGAATEDVSLEATSEQTKAEDQSEKGGGDALESSAA